MVAADSCNKIALKHRAGSIAFMHVEAMDSRAKAAFEAAVVVVFAPRRDLDGAQDDLRW